MNDPECPNINYCVGWGEAAIRSAGTPPATRTWDPMSGRPPRYRRTETGMELADDGEYVLAHMVPATPPEPVGGREALQERLDRAVASARDWLVAGDPYAAEHALRSALQASPPTGVSETLPSEPEFERAIQAAYDYHDDHRKRHPGHAGECQDDWPQAHRLAGLVRDALAREQADSEDGGYVLKGPIVSADDAEPPR